MNYTIIEYLLGFSNMFSWKLKIKIKQQFSIKRKRTWQRVITVLCVTDLLVSVDWYFSSMVLVLIREHILYMIFSVPIKFFKVVYV